jgi:hypothetical protein
MDTKQIREAVLARPFKPFTLRMNDGREFYIRHPEFVAVAPRVVFVFDDRTGVGTQLEPVLIASLQTEEKDGQSAGQA